MERAGMAGLIAAMAEVVAGLPGKPGLIEQAWWLGRVADNFAPLPVDEGGRGGVGQAAWHVWLYGVMTGISISATHNFALWTALVGVEGRLRPPRSQHTWLQPGAAGHLCSRSHQQQSQYTGLDRVASVAMFFGHFWASGGTGSKIFGLRCSVGSARVGGWVRKQNARPRAPNETRTWLDVDLPPDQTRSTLIERQPTDQHRLESAFYLTIIMWEWCQPTSLDRPYPLRAFPTTLTRAYLLTCPSHDAGADLPMV